MTVTNEPTMPAPLGEAWDAFEPVPGRSLGAGGGFWHGVQIYESEAALAATASRFLRDAVEAREGIVVVATKAHHAAFAEILKAQGVDLSAAHACGQFLALDAEETLASFLVNDWPDPQRFREIIGGIVHKVTASGFPRVRVFGEMVALLWEAEQQAAAIRTEELWHELAMTHAFCLLCAYSQASFHGEVETQAYLNVCGMHSHVLAPMGRIPEEFLEAGSAARSL